MVESREAAITVESFIMTFCRWRQRPNLYTKPKRSPLSVAEDGTDSEYAVCRNLAEIRVHPEVQRLATLKAGVYHALLCATRRFLTTCSKHIPREM